MTNKVLQILIILALAVGGVGCAKMESIDSVKFGEESFKDWVANNDPAAKPLANNALVYRKIIEAGSGNGTQLEAGKYVYLNYTISTLNGTYVVTRDSLISRLTGSWDKTTHWCPDYMQFYSENGFFCPGLYAALDGLRVGDSVRVYVAATQAFTSTYIVSNTGYYADETVLYQGFPLICDVRIKEINSNPANAAIEMVDKYAAEHWGMSPKDSVKKGLYMRIISSKPDGVPITEETSVPLYYKQTFMDGFLLGTNNDSIAKVYDRYDENTSYDIMNVTPKAGLGNYDAFYTYILPKMKLGDVAEIVTIPYYTILGNNGSFYTSPQLLTFQPTRFTVITRDIDKGEDGDNT